MTLNELIALGIAAGFGAAVGLTALIAVGLGLHALVERIIDALTTWRGRRQQQKATDDLATCQAIDSLGTTNEPDPH